MNSRTLPDHIIIETRPMWVRGLVAVAIYAALSGVMDHQDAQLRIQDQTIAALSRANNRLATQIATHNSTPSVRLLPNERGKFECSQFHIRHEWILAAQGECERLGQFLIMARASK